jgi:PTH1 family peptidyl-tRNA hydrolase
MGGSAKGHNGVRSTMAHLQSDKMSRLKFGIGRPADRKQVANYVLSEFDETESSLVEATIQSSVELLMMKFAHFIPGLKDSILQEEEHDIEQR